MRSAGTLMILAASAAYGAMAIFGKLAYEQGTGLGTLLVVRFALAALVFWALVVARRQLPHVRAVTRRQLGIALGLGAAGYAIQAGCYFAALERIDASLLTLVLYTFPAMVAIAAVALGRDRLDRRRGVALVLASSGLALVIATAGTGAMEPVGVALALAAAVTYATYILVSDVVVDAVPPVVLSALVCSGAALSLLVVTTVTGTLDLGAVQPVGWAWLVALVLVSTVTAILLFFSGLVRVGPTTAAILSTAEPVVTVGLAMLVFGEMLGPWQVLGGALVLVAVVALHARWPQRAPEPAAA